VRNNTEKLLEVAQDEEEFCMGKWNREKVEVIYTILKPQEWPNMGKTHVAISVQTRSNFTPELCRSILGLVAAVTWLRKSYSTVLLCWYYRTESYLITGAALPHSHQLSIVHKTEGENYGRGGLTLVLLLQWVFPFIFASVRGGRKERKKEKANISCYL